MRLIDLLVDAGEGVGAGHLIRTLALGEELIALDSGCKVRAWIRGHVPSFVASDAVEVYSADTPECAAAVTEAEAVVCDGDRSDWNGITGHRRPGVPLIRITDFEPALLSADLLICPNFGIGQSASGVLAGPRWIILRRQFDAIPARTVTDQPAKVLICLGGAAPPDLLCNAIDGCRRLAPNEVGEIVVVSASKFVGESALSDARVRVCDFTTNIQGLMQRADVGIVGGGTLLYEAMATGLPSIALSQTGDQAREAQTTMLLGCCLHIRAAECRSALTSGLASLRCSSVRKSMSLQSRNAVDGGGRQRVAAALLCFLAGPRRVASPPGEFKSWTSEALQ